MIKDRLECRVQTAHGVSENKIYKHNPGEPRLDGEVQGSGDVPPCFNAQCDIILKVHDELAPGLCIENPTQSRQIKQNNICFADNNDGNTSADRNSDNPIREAVSKLGISVQIWNDLVNFGGGGIALHKCKWQLKAWEYLHGNSKWSKQPRRR